jgi:hypothetical protein
MTDLQKIILVGNGKTVLNSKRGSIIDRFDVVARFNSYVIAGYEDFVGTRTDFLCRRSINNMPMFPRKELKQVFNFITYCPSRHLMKREAIKVSDFYKNMYQEVGVDICQQIGEDIGLDQPNKEWASVGVLAIGYFLKCCPKYQIYLTGFDYAEGVKLEQKAAHYFPRVPSGDRYHNWKKERNWIHKLRNDGKIFFLPLDRAEAESIITPC